MSTHRHLAFLLLAGSLLLAAGVPAAADNEPVIVVPGRAGVPVMMYGVDVSGAVIEGEWGLNRPGVVAPTVIMRYWGHDIYAPASAYFPITGQRPRVGRLEVIPPGDRRRTKPAEPYYRSWESHSDPSPATSPTTYDLPPMVLAPQINPRRPAHGPTPLPLPKPH
jgi:hypothetical protein